LSTLSVVVLSVLAALFAILILAAIGCLIYLYILARRQIAQFTSTVNSVGLRLESQYNRIETLVASVHGNELQKAAEDFISQIPKQAAIATRCERATLLFIDAIKSIGGEFELSGSAVQRARESGLGPEDFAPAVPGERFVSQSRTSLGDAQSLESESESNTQSFNESE
jgi:hypothetical protein